MKNFEKLFLSIFVCVFGFVGAGLLTGGFILLFNNINYKNAYDKISAEITDIEISRRSDGDLRHDVYIKYTYKEKTYNNVRINFYNSNMYEGKEISILCDPENPGKIHSAEGTDIAVIIFIVIGIIFTLVAIILTISIIKKKRRRKRAIASGRTLNAKVQKIVLNTGYTVNGKNPYIIYCTYKDDYYDRIYRFKSDNLWTDPSLILQSGDDIKVYVDEKDYSCYHVDIESIFKGKIIDYT